MGRLRRYEILLPLQFNDGSDVPESLIAATLKDPRLQFGAVSCFHDPVHGQWESEGIVYRDQLCKVWIDVNDSEENRSYFAAFKETLKQRFNQIEIWLTSYPIDQI